jgi:AcrR family transcriptional regulator
MPSDKTPLKRTRASRRPLNDPDRRSVILMSALTVFSEKGFHRATIKDIAKVAGLAEGTIYNHFENKDALLLSLFEGLNARGREKVELALPTEVPLSDFLPAHFEQMLNMFVVSAGKALPVMLAELLTNSALREGYAQRIMQPTFKLGEQALSQWMKEGRIRKKMQTRQGDANNAITARLIGALLLGTVVQHLLGDELIIKHWEKLPTAIADMVLTGIQPTATSDKPKTVKKINLTKKSVKK